MPAALRKNAGSCAATIILAKLLDAIQEADQVVMGTHGRHGVSRAVLGSVAEGLLRISSCPALVVRG